MDKKLQRIVGVLLVLALGMVLSPLLFNKQSLSRPVLVASNQTATVAQPPAAEPLPTQELPKTTEGSSVPASQPDTAAGTPATPADSSAASPSDSTTPAQTPPVVQSAPSVSSAAPASPTPQASEAPAAPASDSQAAETKTHTPAVSVSEQKNPPLSVADDDVIISSVMNPDADDETSPQPDNYFNVLPPQDLNNGARVSSEHAAQDNLDLAKKTNEAVAAKKPETSAAPSDKTAVKTKPVPIAKTAVKNKKPLAASSQKNLENFKKAAWAVKLGTFKNKENAVGLTNKLRAQGYKAFTREIMLKTGSYREVYIGPESEKTSALALSRKLAEETKIQGIIVNYKPLAL